MCHVSKVRCHWLIYQMYQIGESNFYVYAGHKHKWPTLNSFINVLLNCYLTPWYICVEYCVRSF